MIIFIPIKEVSQRVPNKNFRLINGIPLYKHFLYKLNDYQVYVDTDSQKIIENIKKDLNLKHVKVYRRKKELEGHAVSVCDLIKNFINMYNVENKNICQLHVTSPFLDMSTIKKASKKMLKYDSVVSCNVYQNRLWRKETYGYAPINHNPLKLEQTQDLPEYYEENSLFYIFNSNYFIKTNSRIGINPYFYACNHPENIDIDTEDDWKLVTSIAGENK